MVDRLSRLGMPVLASEHGAQIDYLMVLLHLLMAAIFIGWFVFCVYALVRFRQSRHPKASYNGARSHASHYIEVVVIVAQAALLVGLSIPFWVREVAALPGPEKQPVEVRIVAQQFAWNVHYPGPDGVFGQTLLELVDDTSNPIGLDRNDDHAKDDIVTLNQLHLPVDRPAIIHLSAKDVIHSFYLPELRVKQDVIPGMVIPISFTPAMTTEEFRALKDDPARTFEIACAQLCGLGHYRMRGFLTVHPEEAFQAWLEANAPSEDDYDPFWE